jgi:holo-[acyl-carrier protein] synthase
MSGPDPLSGVAVGVDIVETQRLRRLVTRWGEAVLERLFTPVERAGLRGVHGLRWDSLAGRFAAKEATRKLFGRNGEMPRFIDIQVEEGPHGEPVLTLLGGAPAVADRCGLRDLRLSIAHERHSAVAVVIAVQERDPEEAA